VLFLSPTLCLISHRRARTAHGMLDEDAMHIDPTHLSDLSADRIQLSGAPVTSVLRSVVFPGAFNPLHKGHLRMATLASQLCEAPVDFELSIQNVDKPEVADEEVARRAGQFSGDQVLWITRAPTFAEKAAVFPQATFVLGADTAIRLANLWYYNGDLTARATALEQVRAHGCRFLVFGRLVRDVYRGLDELGLPEEWLSLCMGVSEEMFRMDISSSELRK